MKQILFITVLFITSCGSLKVMRDCSQAKERQEYVCKSLGFWE